MITGPRDPTPREARLPDDVDQTPDAAASPLDRSGSQDAELLSGAAAAEGDVAQDSRDAPTAETIDPGLAND